MKHLIEINRTGKHIDNVQIRLPFRFGFAFNGLDSETGTVSVISVRIVRWNREHYAYRTIWASREFRSA